jgi:hypothetical protein
MSVLGFTSLDKSCIHKYLPVCPLSDFALELQCYQEIFLLFFRNFFIKLKVLTRYTFKYFSILRKKILTISSQT